ncbi:hypothetical protein TRFO_18373 [Tritrichomonas foetus]|uniref:Uncharacterized protein n=1 Tax=Tritrichomonas foetus TaxID=1144522 RepID=A0A1J4KQC1_9EUKA|nr:hypothetical protein TRFO_18373 [Tritrichomonas foetus]|eukprot:OHT11988.1 hypothetical protein TRFO_18373 [Tritrichomonas foetus]
MSAIFIGAAILLGIAVAVYFFFVKNDKKGTSKSNSKNSHPNNNQSNNSQKNSMKEEKKEDKKEDKIKQTKQQKQQKQQSKPMETAEHYMTVGNTIPICMSFEQTGEYFVVACRNRQQILFEVNGIDKNAPGKQRYRLTDDTVVDCSFFTNNSKQLEVAFALDRSKSIQSFVLIPNSNKFENGQINIPNAGKLTVDKIQVAPDQSFVAALGDETYIRVFHPNGTHLFAKDTSQMRNTEITVSSNSELVSASSYTSEIVVYGIDRDRSDVPSKVTKAFSFSEHKNSIQTLDFDRKTMLIASGSKDCKYNVWLAPLRWREGDIARLQWSGTLPEPIFLIRMCPTSQMVACVTENGKLYFCTKEGIQKTVDVAHNMGVADIKWSPDGRFVVVMSHGSQFLYAFERPN